MAQTDGNPWLEPKDMSTNPDPGYKNKTVMDSGHTEDAP